MEARGIPRKILRTHRSCISVFNLAIDQNLLSFWVLFSYEKYIRPVLLSILRVRYSAKMLLKDGRSEKEVGGWEKWKHRSSVKTLHRRT